MRRLTPKLYPNRLISNICQDLTNSLFQAAIMLLILVSFIDEPRDLKNGLLRAVLK